jgi:single-stranded-DNA-specific exonuclease
VLISQQWFVQQNLPGPNLANFLDLVALGTVADVVPLDQNNRILVHQGLQRIKAKHCRPGIQALLEVAEKQSAHICATDLGFVLGPRLNAAGRLDDMTIGIQCLLSNNLNDARLFAAQLDDLNRQRKEIESTMQQEAMAILAEFSLSEQQIPDGICLYQDDWHQGIIGILAGRVKDKYHRPTIVFAQQDDQTLKGSARSIAGLHIRDLLELMNTRHPDLIVKFGGHAMAAGLSLKTEKLPVFSQLFDEFVKQALTPDMLEGTIDSDGPLTPDLYSVSFAQTLQKEGPWGQGFPEPIFDDHFEMINQRLVGQKHLKMTLKQGDVLIDAIKFNADLDLWPNNQCKQVHVAFRLDINRFRGQTQVQLIVVDLAQVVT